ncbi:flagellar transcriptional regulator FlhD [Aquincola tertiaricarbonis]|uniref:Flagellar transcriptional regulator FlhD n=1 Tax=Aquincola tertiaricarbonis TaxID=391953 RepID=A0ABY4S6Z3_AQUTE|nr:flagellar transcriptional regulator FlhD [Aquincola tertiaricarbonis]URI07980.1 flagellar transcriptional regulator FlhD [Aquincola tertiaricarbonis]
MNSSQILAEIREANVAYLMLAQTLLRADRDAALQRLGLSASAAEVIERMTPAQLSRAAASNTLICSFRMDDELVWDLLTHHVPAVDLPETGAARTRKA